MERYRWTSVVISDQRFRIPTLGTRFAASLIDDAFILLLFVVFRLAANFGLGGPLAFLLLLAMFLYHPVAIAAVGTTIGKALLGLYVIRVRDAAKPGFGAALGRWLLFYVVPLGVIIAWIGALTDDENRGWHDKGAGTIVVMK